MMGDVAEPLILTEIERALVVDDPPARVSEPAGTPVSRVRVTDVTGDTFPHTSLNQA